MTPTTSRETTTTRVYRYGLRAPIDGAARVAQQMRAAHTYYNQLIELDRHRRDRLRALESATRPIRDAITAARTTLDQLVDELRRERRSTRRRSESAELREQIKVARAELRGLTREFLAARRANADGLAAERDAINEEFLAARRAARPGISKVGADGLVAGTYQLVEDAAQQASAATPLWDGDQPTDPRFKRWTGDAVVSVQIPGGLAVSEVMDGGSTHVAITEPLDATRDRRDPCSRRSQLRKRVTLWLRVGSMDDRSPRWAQWPMVLHRPIPPDGRVQRVTVRVSMIGPRPEWSVEFTVRMGQPAATHGDGGAVAIDVGWRETDRGLRLGVTCDERGAGQELVMPPRIREGLLIPGRLVSIRDRNMDAARARLVAWLATATVPEWLAEATTTIGQWRAQARLAALAIRWRDARFDGDAEAFDALEAWRKQDKHLWLWETSQRKGSLRARHDWFRVTAAALARAYGTLILERFDLRQVVKRRPAGADTAENEVARTNRQLAGISILRLCLRNAFLARGGRVVEVDPANTTRTCSVCGVVETWDAAASIRHTCTNGHAWDQDENAARNMIERWRSDPGPDPARTIEPPTESRRERVRRKRAEKLQRMGRSQDAPEQPMAAEA